VLSIDGVGTLPNVVIANPTQVDLVSWAVISCEVIVTVVAQVKDDFLLRLMHDKHVFPSSCKGF